MVGKLVSKVGQEKTLAYRVKASSLVRDFGKGEKNAIRERKRERESGREREREKEREKGAFSMNLCSREEQHRRNVSNKSHENRKIILIDKFQIIS